MNVGPYQHQQQNYPQFNPDQSHPSLHSAPPTDNSFGNVPRAVNNDMVARVPPEMHNLSHQMGKMSVHEQQPFSDSLYAAKTDITNNVGHYENSFQSSHQPYQDQLQDSMNHSPAIQTRPNAVNSYPNANAAPPAQFPSFSPKDGSQSWPANNARDPPSLPPSSNQTVIGPPPMMKNHASTGPPSMNNRSPPRSPSVNNHLVAGAASIQGSALVNNHIAGPHVMSNNFGGPPSMNNHASALPPMGRAALPQQQSSLSAINHAPSLPPMGRGTMFQQQQPNQGRNARPPTLPPNYQYNQKSSLYPPAQYPMNQANGIPNDPALTGNMPPPMHGPAYPQSHYPQQPAQQMRLDPDHMPNPIQVMFDDQEAHGKEPFITNRAGMLPPLVTTSFITEDEGNANPRFIRSTMYSIPCTTDMMKQADIPFSLVITPLATIPTEEQVPPLVDTGLIGPVRCVRCKAYMNPYMKFIDGGRRFSCVLCSAPTEVPQEYFQHLDHTGARVDRYDRPELLYGAYELTVTKEYCKETELPTVPAFIFVIDVSYNNVRSGMVKLFCEQITDIIQNHMPIDEVNPNGENIRMRVGFITYDSTVHFYNIKSCLGQPQMMLVGDVDDMFVPLLDGFLCDPVESSAVIQSLMQQIPNTFCDTKETDTLLLPAVKAGLEALKAAKCAGKLFVFHSSLPTGNAPGKLTNREDRKLLGTDKEKTILTPQNSSYTNLALECVTAGCSIDLYILNNAYVDLPTIGQLSKITGGEIFKYTYFQAAVDGERLMEDVRRNLSRQIAFDAVMRVRTSTGIRPVDFYGNFSMTTSTDIELASINADKSIAVEIKHDDKLPEEDGAFIQVAFLYTSCSGQRRVRILNLALTCCTQMAELFRYCDLDTLINYWSKAAVSKLLEGTPRQVKESIVNRSARILACYRKLVANPSSPGQLILPECMKLLPLYVNCLIKSDAISGGPDMAVDDRCSMMHAVSIMDIPSSLNYFYPRVLPLVNVDLQMMPTPVRCTSYKLTNQEAYILENGVYMFLWIGSSVPKEWLVNVFGVADFSLINVNLFRLPVFENDHSRCVNSIIELIQSERRRTMKLTIVREHDKLEIVFKRFLAEDGLDGSFNPDNLSSASYVDFLCHLHKEIRNMLT